MTEPKIVSLNFGHGGGSRAQPFSYEVQRSKRKTLAIYISHRKVVVRCPLRASALELRQFVSATNSGSRSVCWRNPCAIRSCCELREEAKFSVVPGNWRSYSNRGVNSEY